MKTKNGIIISALILACLMMPLQAWGMDPLSDEQMDNITAGSTSTWDGILDNLLTNIPFNYRGNNSEAIGDILIFSPPAQSTYNTTNNFHQTNNMGSLNITDNAQQNLSSLININAVNSPVNVLLNLNITLDSTIGTLVQQNWLNGMLQP
ncbi:MAG: hypothetical protein HUK40_20145 [Desulfobacter sp.]|nr:hypothetical protein [Desulfobacter sp.]WDP86472.1 MAG: hypothetical protein HUN05_16175 [Desulfobacter sp.]